MTKKRNVRQRTKKGEIPRIHRRKDRNAAFILIEGKKHYVGTWDDNGIAPEAEANRLRIWHEYQAEKGIARQDCRTVITVAVLIDRFLEHAKQVYVKHGRLTGTYRRFVEVVRPLFQLYADTPVTEFTPLALKALRHGMVESGTLCRETINKRIDCIRQMFRWGVENEMLPETTWRALTAVARLKAGKTTAVDHPDVEPVPVDVVQRTLPHLPPAIADMVRIQLRTGMRPSEVCNLRPYDIYKEEDTFPAKYAYLQKDLDGVWIYIPSEYKTEHHEGKERWIPLGFKCQEILIPYLAEREPKEFIFSPEKERAIRSAQARAKRKTKKPVSDKPVRTYGEKYTSRSYRSAIAHAIVRYNRQAEKSGAETLPHWFPYQLRHTKATETRANGEIETLQILMGHSSIDMTEIYAKKNKDLAIQHAIKNG